MNASVLWDIVSRAKIECHEAAGRVAFYLARDAYPIGHERNEITLLFCLRYFRYCTLAFEVQCFRVLHRAVYRSWCVNSHEPIHENLELEAVIAAKDFLDLHW